MAMSRVFRREVVRRPAGDPDLSLFDRVEPRDHPEQGRLAAAGGTDQGDEFAVGNRDGYAVDDLRPAVGFAHVDNVHRRHFFSSRRADLHTAPLSRRTVGHRIPGRRGAAGNRAARRARALGRLAGASGAGVGLPPEEIRGKCGFRVAPPTRSRRPSRNPSRTISRSAKSGRRSCASGSNRQAIAERLRDFGERFERRVAVGAKRLVHRFAAQTGALCDLSPFRERGRCRRSPPRSMPDRRPRRPLRDRRTPPPARSAARPDPRSSFQWAYKGPFFISGRHRPNAGQVRQTSFDSFRASAISAAWLRLSPPHSRITATFPRSTSYTR